MRKTITLVRVLEGLWNRLWSVDVLLVLPLVLEPGVAHQAEVGHGDEADCHPVDDEVVLDREVFCGFVENGHGSSLF
jgi:hypothetical protein